MTPVVLEGMPHEMQTEPQSSLPLTPRLPIDGEPCKCKQEVADSVMTAECTNGMVQSANLPEIVDIDGKAALCGELAERASRVDEGSETDVDVYRTPTLGREPAARDCGVDEGDGMEHEGTQL